MNKFLSGLYVQLINQSINPIPSFEYVTESLKDATS